MLDKNRESKQAGGSLPKFMKKKLKPPIDKWERYRPLKRTWECENCKFQIIRDDDIKTIDIACSCGGKFVRTDVVERASRTPETEYGWLLFLESRKGQGKAQFLQFQSFMLNKRNEYRGGWVPYTVIKEYMESKCSIDQTQLDRLMDDMQKSHIVDKKMQKDPSMATPNKSRKFYRYNDSAAMRTLTTTGFKKEYSRLFSENIALNHQLIFAKTVLQRHGLIQEYQDELKKWETRGKRKD